MNKASIEWDDKTIERLRMFWQEGRSASQIAAYFGISRNAVIGKLHRLNEKREFHPRSGRPKETRRPDPMPTCDARRVPPTPRKPRSNINAVLNPQFARAAYVRPAEETPVGLPTTGRVALLELRHGECRYPIGDPRERGFGFCGEPAMVGASHVYCAGHARLCYQGANERNAYDNKLTRQALAAASAGGVNKHVKKIQSDDAAVDG